LAENGTNDTAQPHALYVSQVAKKTRTPLQLQTAEMDVWFLIVKNQHVRFSIYLQLRVSPLAATNRQTQKHLRSVKQNSARKLINEQHKQGQFGARPCP
jgi:hypothetical protein